MGGAISAGCYEKPWLFKVNFSGPLLAAALYTFQGAKCFTRVLAPALEKYVEDGIFYWAEEERLSRAMQESVEQAGVKDSHRKKAVKHLMAAYDDAHFKAPYGTHTAGTPEFCMLQDFVKGWIMEFAHRAYDVLHNGVEGCDSSSNEAQILFLTCLFQALTNADRACLPHELTSMIAEPPPDPWPFIAITVESIYKEHERKESQQQAAKRTKGKGGNPPVGVTPTPSQRPQAAFTPTPSQQPQAAPWAGFAPLPPWQTNVESPPIGSAQLPPWQMHVENPPIGSAQLPPWRTDGGYQPQQNAAWSRPY